LDGKALLYAVRAIIKRQHEEILYKEYITQALKTVVENTANSCLQGGKVLNISYSELISPKPKEKRTGDEIAADVLNRLFALNNPETAESAD